MKSFGKIIVTSRLRRIRSASNRDATNSNIISCFYGICNSIIYWISINVWISIIHRKGTNRWFCNITSTNVKRNRRSSCITSGIADSGGSTNRSGSKSITASGEGFSKIVSRSRLWRVRGSSYTNTINSSIICSSYSICCGLIAVTNIKTGRSSKWRNRGILCIRFINGNTLCISAWITGTVSSGGCKCNCGISPTVIIKLKLFLKIIVGARLKNLGSSVIYTNGWKSTAASITSTNSKSNVSGGSRIV